MSVQRPTAKWSDFIVPSSPYKDEETSMPINSFQYAGPLRIPPQNFQVRSRKETFAQDTVNSRIVESTNAAVPQQQTAYYRIDLPNGGIMTKMEATPHTREESAVYNAFPLKNVSVAEVRAALLKVNNNVERAIGNLTYMLQQEGRDKSAPSDSTVPPALMPTYFDMAPMNTRSDVRDFRQAKPYDAAGPNLALNPFFDRYDPTRDPRNMVREVRSVVYELKEPDRGIHESERIRERTFTNRYMAEVDTPVKITESYNLLRPKIDNGEVVYRTQSELWKLGSEYGTEQPK